MLNNKNKKQDTTGKKAGSIMIAAVVVLIFGVIAYFIAVMPKRTDEPQIIAQVIAAPEETEVKMQKQQVAKQASAASSSAASSVANMIRAQSTAQIAVPDVDTFQVGPVGLGDGDFGSGFGSGNGDGMGSGSTMFGGTGSGSLRGYLYDIKRDGRGKPRRIAGMESVPQSYKDFMPHLHKLIRSDFSESSLSDHTRVGRPLYFNFLAIPKQDAEIGPEAFGAKGEMKPSGWLAIYQGRVQTEGFGTEIRLVGRFDDVLLVFHNGKLVLDGSWVIGRAPTATNFRPSGEIPDHPHFRQPGRIGPWFKLSGGDELVIVVGEIPGGHLGGGLFCQEKGVNYKKGQFAPFVIGKLSADDRKRLEAFPGCTLENIPEFF